MYRIVLTFVMYLVTVLNLTAQYTEIGPMIGGSLYYGDLSPVEFMNNFKLIRPNAGIYYQRGLNDYLALRANLIIMELEGDDNINAEKTWRYNRNLHFKNTVYEATLLLEYNWFGASFYSNRKFSPYIYTGIGFYKHNPRSYLNGDLYFLRDYGTEGQGLEGNESLYNLFQINIPGGGGLKYIFNDKFNLSVEFGFRITFTDYLDDVSHRYPDLVRLSQERGDLSVRLSNKTRNQSDVYKLSRGIRGNSWKDYFYVGSVKLGINLNELGRKRGNGCYNF